MLGRNAKLAKILVYRILVPKCAACNEPLGRDDRALCPKCMTVYREIKTRNCPECAKLYSECSCTNKYLAGHFVKGLAKLMPYRNTERFAPANALIYKMKRKKRKDIFDFMADELSAAILASLPQIEEGTVVTNVPNRRKTVAFYGFDHAGLLAKAVAERLGCEYIPLLRSLAKKPQKMLMGSDRIKNATFDLIEEPNLKGKTVLIIDDIVTTGASMGNSATMIRALCPKAIYGACIGIAHSPNT